MDKHVFYLQFSTWLRMMVAKMEKNELKECSRTNRTKIVYGAYETMPKPTTPKEADFILKFIKKSLRITYEDFEEDIVKDENGSVDVCRVICSVAIALDSYCDNEDEVTEVLKHIINLRKRTGDALDAMMFDGKKIKLSKTKDDSDSSNDEQAQLEVIEIVYMINMMAKNGFDKIHDAWRVKRLFK
jgi:hypothetical protein